MSNIKLIQFSLWFTVSALCTFSNHFYYIVHSYWL